MIIEQLSPDGVTPLWGKAQIEAAFASYQLPSWVADSYSAFLNSVQQKDYPCHFATMSERKDRMRYAIAPSLTTPEALEHVLQAVYAYLEVVAAPKTERLLSALVVFFPIEAQVLSLDLYAEQAFTFLNELHQRDRVPWPASIPTDSTDPDWCYCLGGHPLFVITSNPAYRNRRSRNLGPGLTMIFDSEDLFLEAVEELGKNSTPLIYQRVAQYDKLPPHPLEWPRGSADKPEYSDREYLHRDVFLLPDSNDEKYTFPFVYHSSDDKQTDCPFHQSSNPSTSS